METCKWDKPSRRPACGPDRPHSDILMAPISIQLSPRGHLTSVAFVLLAKKVNEDIRGVVVLQGVSVAWKNKLLF